MKALLPATLLLAACTSLVPGTIGRLSGLDPLEADPAQFEVALSLPAGIDVLPGGALLTLSAERTGLSTTERFTLERADVMTLGGAIIAQPGGGIVLYRLARADLPRIRAQQELIRAWKAEDANTQGSLGIALSPCLSGSAPAEGAEGAVWLRMEAGGAFLPLVRPTPLENLYDAGEMAAFTPCD